MLYDFLKEIARRVFATDRQLKWRLLNGSNQNNNQSNLEKVNIKAMHTNLILSLCSTDLTLLNE